MIKTIFENVFFNMGYVILGIAMGFTIVRLIKGLYTEYFDD